MRDTITDMILERLEKLWDILQAAFGLFIMSLIICLFLSLILGKELESFLIFTTILPGIYLLYELSAIPLGLLRRARERKRAKQVKLQQEKSDIIKMINKALNDKSLDSLSSSNGVDSYTWQNIKYRDLPNKIKSRANELDTSQLVEESYEYRRTPTAGKRRVYQRRQIAVNGGDKS